jgi:hypothetical protein
VTMRALLADLGIAALIAAWSFLALVDWRHRPHHRPAPSWANTSWRNHR